MGDEGQGRDGGGLRGAADHQVQGRAGRREAAPHVAHGDGRAQAGREPAGRDAARRGAIRCGDDRPGAGRGASVRAQADAQPGGAVPQLVADHGLAGEPALGPAALADGPGQVGLDRRRQLVNVRAIQAQPCLQPQAVTRAQPGGQHVRLGQQKRRQRLGLVRRHRDLEPVLPSVAGAADPGGDAADAGLGGAHEGQGGGGRAQGGHDAGGGGALQGQQGAVRVLLHRHVCRQVLRRDRGRIGVPTAGVGHDNQAVAVVGHHQVVLDAAGLVEQQGVALAARLAAPRKSPGVRRSSAAAAPGPCRLSCPMCDTSNRAAWVRQCLCSARTPAAVVDGQGVAGERHHACAQVPRCRASSGTACSTGGSSGIGRECSGRVRPRPAPPDTGHAARRRASRC